MIVKTSIIIACIISLCCINSMNAQWYYNKYGVTDLNDLSNDQLLEGYSSAKTLSIVGGVVTATGVGVMICGLAAGLVNVTEDVVTVLVGQPPSNESYGGALMISGAVLTVGGIITWITGGSRNSEMSPLIKSRGLALNISVYPGVGYDLLTATYYPAVTLSIGF